jgi:hypothetical protein
MVDDLPESDFQCLNNDRLRWDRSFRAPETGSHPINAKIRIDLLGPCDVSSMHVAYA